MGTPRLDPALVRRLHGAAGAAGWQLSIGSFAEALERSANRMFGENATSARAVTRYLESLHLQDLALACACADGSEAAWEYFVREQRPGLYRAAQQIDPTGGAREIADSLYADLYGLANHAGERKSLFRYFHGRSSLATWLRSVLAQRHVDRMRAQRHLTALSDEQIAASGGVSEPHNPDRVRHVALIQQALAHVLLRLTARDRLRLGCYYAQGLTLAQIGRLVGEHEATVSRHLARTRRAIRDEVERELREGAALGDAEIADCFASALDDPGPIDLTEMLSVGLERKKPVPDRSL
jgi:RNA polymerase sigma-70 factor (ECF subfamily)